MNLLNDIDTLADKYKDRHPEEILSLALESVSNLGISFSGAEDVVLIDMAHKINPDLKVFSLDTGRLHEETYAFMKEVEQYYNIVIERMTPDPETLAAFIAKKGLFSFYEDGHHECCKIRKTAPLRLKLASLDGWVTGQRKDQSPDTRSQIAVLEIDPVFSPENTPLYKFNPLANWSSTQVWEYIRSKNVPYNPLHDRSYRSIGCEPCTRAVKPEEHERAGRWWWEEATTKECGLHQGNMKQS